MGHVSFSGHFEKNSLGGEFAIPECLLLNVHAGKYSLPFWSLIPTSSAFFLQTAFSGLLQKPALHIKICLYPPLCYPSITTGLRLIGGDHCLPGGGELGGVQGVDPA